MIKIDRISMSLSSGKDDLFKKVDKLMMGKGGEKYIYKKAIDARNKKDVHFVYSVIAECKNEKRVLERLKYASLYEEKNFEYPLLKKSLPFRPVIVGSGPAGSFAALCLAYAGARPIILERGKEVDERKKDVDIFFEKGKLKEESNVQFGEGGAGTFSDGKLNTGTKSPYIRKILSEYVRFGASSEIMYDSKPHIGTDVLKKIAKNLRSEVERYGGTYLFSNKLNDIGIKNGKVVSAISNDVIETECILLALGHSARDTFRMIDEKGIKMIQKPFSVGVRIEHPQEMINEAQYGSFANHEALGPADYKFASSCYTFCMCPGGYVVASSSEENSIVTNGMSFSDRGGENANSALLVNVDSKDFGENLFDGMEFQRRLERASYDLSGSYAAPAQKLSDFMKDFKTHSFGAVKPTYMPGVTPENIRSFMPGNICDKICEGVTNIDRKLKGFALPEAVLTAPETRSSSPVRILRDEKSYESVSVKGLYPCGEGAGYAGGIMSAASDGLRCAVKIIEKYNGDDISG